MDYPTSHVSGIDIVDYDFTGGMRVKTNRMFTSQKPGNQTSRSVNASSNLTFNRNHARNLS